MPTRIEQLFHKLKDQKRAEQADDERTAEAAGGPHHAGPFAARPPKLKRKLARAERERREHGDRNGGA